MSPEDAGGEPVEAAPPVFVIGGRPYVLVGEGSLEHDVYHARELRACGLLPNGVAVAAVDPAATLGDNAVALLLAVYESGHTFTLLAGLLVPEGAAWTPALAREMAADFARVRDRPSKQILQGVLAGALPTFLDAALRSAATSPSSSSRPTSPGADGARGPHDSPQVLPFPYPNASPTAAPGTMPGASGPTSSGD